MPKISRRTAELGTENAFVVLAPVNGLVRQGRDVQSPSASASPSSYAASKQAIEAGVARMADFIRKNQRA